MKTTSRWYDWKCYPPIRPTEADVKRNFLAVFWLPVPKPEHAKIVEVLKSASKGDCKQAFVFGDMRNGATLGYLFTYDSKPWHVDFSKVLLNGDNYLVIEVTDLHVQYGLGVANTWLRSHPAPQKLLGEE